MLIDFHAHLTPNVTPQGFQLTVEQLLAEMDSHGIDRAAVLPLESPEVGWPPVTTWEVLHDCQGHLDRLIPFCVVDPRVARMTRGDFKRFITPYVEAGCKGFGEHLPGVAVDDPRSMGIYAVCGELGLAVVFDFDIDYNMDDPGLPRFEKVVQRLPETIFIGHGPAWWANISAEPSLEITYPEGKIVPGGAVPHLLSKYENVYADLSARSGYNALARDLAHARGFLHQHSGKLLFGTDVLMRGQQLPIVAFLREFGLEAGDWENISHANAERLLVRVGR